MPDQLRPGFLGCHDAGFIDRPHIDSLADRGVQYNNAHTPSRVSRSGSPRRGVDAIKNGLLDNEHLLHSDDREWGIGVLLERLNDAG